jgi:hypothetical protein
MGEETFIQEDLGTDGRIMLKLILKIQGRRKWYGCICFWTGSCDRLL